MQNLNDSEIEAVSGGDGVAVAGGMLVGVAAGALVIGTGGGILLCGFLGGTIWGGIHWMMTPLRPTDATGVSTD